MLWAIKGNIIYSKNSDELVTVKNGFLVCKDDKIIKVYKELPEEYKDIQITDYGNHLVIPGLCDLHVHAPQYTYRGSGMDLELLDWLNAYTFPEEAKFKNIDYAKKNYNEFVNALKKSPTTRASIYATIHVDSTVELMNLLEESGLTTYVGKVNMDRNSPDILTEENAETAMMNTIEWLETVMGKYQNTMPVITPRFIPSCDGELLKILGELSEKYNIPNQSHLSENINEINWVRELEPESDFYGDAYYRYNLFGGKNKTIMAHCVYSEESEIELIKQQGVYIAHCPASNTNIASGIAPAKRYLDENLNIGLGTDVAGGHSLSMFRAIADAIQVSKLRWRLVDSSFLPLKVSEAFYMATKGGGSFFGKVGSFEKDYEMDAVVIDDSMLNKQIETNIENRLERIIYLDNEVNIVSKYVKGKKVL
jgi:guanine deaminase